MKIGLLLFAILFTVIGGSAQHVGIGTTTPDNSAKIDISSSNKGFLPPRMTLTQRIAIPNPATGLVIWCSDCNEMQVFDGFIWKNMEGSKALDSNLPSVKIGNDIWTIKNLNVRTYRNGDSIPLVTDPVEWSNLTTGAMCYWGNLPNYISLSGGYYNWYAVNDPRGLAPLGWHISTEVDWQNAAASLGSIDSAGVLMRDTCPTCGFPGGANGIPANNYSGFTGIPVGLRFPNGAFESIFLDASWFWTSTLDQPSGLPVCHYLPYDGAMILTSPGDKRYGFNVRCVRD